MKKRNLFFVISLIAQICKLNGMEKEIEYLEQDEMECETPNSDFFFCGDSHPEDELLALKKRIATLLTQKAFQAIAQNDWKALEMCFEPMVNVDAQDEKGQTLLYTAIASADKDTIETLLLHGADVNVLSGKFQVPPLNIALMNDEEIAKMLLANGDIDLKLSSNDGSTALHEAIMFKRNGLIEELIKRGAEVNAQNQAGQTPLNCALSESRPNAQAAEILKNHGAFENISYEHKLRSQTVQPPVCFKKELTK